MSVVEKRAGVSQAMSEYDLSERHACRVLQISRSVYRSQSEKADDEVIDL